MVLFYKTSGINSWLSYLLSCQGHGILVLQIRIMLSSSTVLSVFSIWSVGKQCASATWGRNTVNKKSFLRSSSRMLSAADNKSVEAIYRVHNKNLGFQKGDVSTRWAHKETLWVSQKAAVVSSMCSKSFEAVFPRYLMKDGCYAAHPVQGSG